MGRTLHVDVHIYRPECVLTLSGYRSILVPMKSRLSKNELLFVEPSGVTFRMRVTADKRVSIHREGTDEAWRDLGVANVKFGGVFASGIQTGPEADALRTLFIRLGYLEVIGF